jgi:hypothetical protein
MLIKNLDTCVVNRKKVPMFRRNQISAYAPADLVRMIW